MNILGEPYWQPIGVVLAAAAIHATYQTSVSVLTLLSNHSLGFGRSHNRILGLGLSYIAGVLAANIALAIGLVYLLWFALDYRWDSLWITAGGLALTGGLLALFLYFRKDEGTTLRWMPRGVADYLYHRMKKTKQGIEAFALGLITVIAELPFVLVTLLVLALTMWHQPNQLGFGTLLLYNGIIILPLIVLLVLVGGGTKMSKLQQWREKNKGFLQFTTGFGLALLGLLLLIAYLPNEVPLL